MKESRLAEWSIILLKVIPAVLLVLVLSVSCSTLPDRIILSDAYYNLGNSELDKGNSQEAEKYFSTAFSYNPDNRSASYNLAITYTLNGKFAEAESVLQLLLADDPDNVIVQNASAWNMYKSSKFNSAIELYESVLSNNPAYDELRKNCIRVCLEVGDFDKAAFHLDFLIGNRDLDSDILYLKGELHFLQNNPEAEDWYIAAWKKDLENKEAISRLEEILHNNLEEKPILELYNKLDAAGLLNPQYIYDFSLQLLTLKELSGFDYLRKAVQLGFDVSQVKKSDIDTLSDPIKKDFVDLISVEFLRKYQ